MRELRTSGSVGAGGGQPPSATRQKRMSAGGSAWGSRRKCLWGRRLPLFRLSLGSFGKNAFAWCPRPPGALVPDDSVGARSARSIPAAVERPRHHKNIAPDRWVSCWPAITGLGGYPGLHQRLRTVREAA